MPLWFQVYLELKSGRHRRGVPQNSIITVMAISEEMTVFRFLKFKPYTHQYMEVS